MTAPTVERPHGYARYKLDGCRCYTCAWAVSQYNLDRERQIIAGTWQPYVDAEPVRAHVRACMAAGIGWRRLAALTGVSPGVIRKLLWGDRGAPPSQRIRPEAAAALLSVQPTPAALADGAVVDATGTHRRIQALACMGWTLTAQARRIGWTITNYAHLLERTHVVKETADKVRALFEELSMLGAPAGVGATRIRNMAAARGWAPPLAWDDDTIDDPRARPRGQRLAGAR